jgi:hypothetical protein
MKISWTDASASFFWGGGRGMAPRPARPPVSKASGFFCFRVWHRGPRVCADLTCGPSFLRARARPKRAPGSGSPAAVRVRSRSAAGPGGLMRRRRWRGRAVRAAEGCWPGSRGGRRLGSGGARLSMRTAARARAGEYADPRTNPLARVRLSHGRLMTAVTPRVGRRRGDSEGAGGFARVRVHPASATQPHSSTGGYSGHD